MTPFHETAAAGPIQQRAAEMQALVPVLETAHLILRAPRIEDFAAFARIVLGRQGKHYGQPKSREDAWQDFMQITGTWFLRGHGAWTVTDRHSGEVAGFVHIGAEPGDREPELGYLVAQEAEGRGIAQEAAAAVRDAAIGLLGLPSLVSYVDPGNARSIRLAARLGGTRDTTAEAALPGEGTCLVFRFVAPQPDDDAAPVQRPDLTNANYGASE